MTKIVTITGAGGRIAYALIPLICEGGVFGQEPVHLKLLEVPAAMQRLEGIRLEMEDCAFPLLHKCEITSDVEQAMRDSDVVILLGGFPRKPGMERKDLIQANTDIIKAHAEGIESFAKRDVHVLIVANPANTNALTASSVAKSIPIQNFTCLTRLDEERLKNLICQKIKSEDSSSTIMASDIKDVCIFGNHSATQVPSIEAGYVDFGIQKTPISCLCQAEWLLDELTPKVQERGATVMNAQGASSAMSAASAITKHLKDLLGPEVPTALFSMGVCSDGNQYGIPEGLFYSFPCRRLEKAGYYEIANEIKVNSETNERMLNSAKELLEEKACLSIASAS